MSNLGARIARLEKVWPERREVIVPIAPFQKSDADVRQAVADALAAENVAAENAAVYLCFCLSRRGNELYTRPPGSWKVAYGNHSNAVYLSEEN